MYASKVFNIKISQFYFEVGHSQNSGDSMHSVIETKSKNQEIFTQDKWVEIIHEACKKPYIINQIQFNDIFDFHQPAALFPWKNAKISKIREIVFLPNNLIQIKYDNYYNPYKDFKFFDDVKFDEIYNSGIFLQQAYVGKIPLEPGKIKDIKELIQRGIIPSEFANFYEKLYC